MLILILAKGSFPVDQPIMTFSQHMLILSLGKGIFPTRSANYGILLTHANFKFGQRGLSHNRCKVWNAFLKDVQEHTNLNSFENILKA